MEDKLRDARIAVEDLTTEQRKADQAVEAVRTRRTRDQQRMDSGAISNPKDLERMQHELVSLDRRISVLEDEELEVMERLETAQETMQRLEQELAGTDERLAVLVEARDAKFAEIDAQLAEVTAERGPATDGMPADLMALYERLREQKNGVGAAEIRARECGGCRISLDPAEIASIRSASSDEVVRCQECSRILVRTAESGL